MKTDHDTEDEEQTRERLTETAGKIEAWRTAHKVPKEQMPKRFSQYIKSYRNIERAAAGQLDEMDHEKNLVAFQNIWSLINTPTAKSSERAYDDFSAAARLRDAFMRTMTKTGPNRCILLIGATGSGKTKAREVLVKLWRSRILAVDATKVWRDKPHALLSAIWRALGKTDVLKFGDAGLTSVIEVLKSERRCVLIDEAHYCGPDQLNTITTLINQTPGEFILIGQPTLWSRLENDSGVFLEARQLTKNRLSRKITLGSINANDAELMIARRLPALNGTTQKAVAEVLKHASQHGNLAFVRNCIERCEEAAEETSSDTTYEDFISAVRDELAER